MSIKKIRIELHVIGYKKSRTLELGIFYLTRRENGKRNPNFFRISTYHTFLRHSSCNELTEAVIWKTRAFFSLLVLFKSELIAKLSTKRFRKKFNLFCLLCL